MYATSALAFLGFFESSADDFADWAVSAGGVVKSIYIVEENLMNKCYNLEGLNKYRADLTIVALVGDFAKVVTARLPVKAKWFNDIAENNRA